MKRTTKSILALVVLVAMCVSFCVPAFAEAIDNHDESTEATTVSCPGADKTHKLEILGLTPETAEDYIVKVVPAPCQGRGYTIYKCPVCEQKFVDNWVDGDAADHTYDEENAETELPTCTKDGYIKYTCTKCGNEITETLYATGHEWSDEVIYKDGVEVDGYLCTDEGITLVKTCGCGEEETTAVVPGDHVLTETWVHPTCQSKGTVTYGCEKCSYNKVVDAYVDMENLPADYHTKLVYDDKAEGYVAPTCEAEGLAVNATCKACGATGDFAIPKVEHKWNEVKATAPTCTKDGNIKYYTCEYCEAISIDKTDLVEEEDVVDPMLNHKNKVKVDAESAGNSCYPGAAPIEGYVAGTLIPIADAVVLTEANNGWGVNVYTCPDCNGAKYVEYVAPKDHPQMGDHIEEPTHTSWGFKGKICLTCGFFDKDTMVMLPPYTHVVESVDNVPANMKKVDDRSTEPSCGVKGTYVYECQICKEDDVADRYAELSIDELGHDYVETVVTPTCKKDGYTWQICSCGDVLKTVEGKEADADGKYDKVTIAEYKVAIDYDNLDPTDDEDYKILCAFHNTTNTEKKTTTAPTCTLNGWSRTFCADCSWYAERQDVPALNHPEANRTNVIDVTVGCENDGGQSWVCGLCNEPGFTKTADKLGHSYYENDHADQYDATENKYYSIVDGNKVYLGTRVEVVAPTCTEGGYTVIACGRCGTEANWLPTTKTGHSWEAADFVATRPEDASYGYIVYPTCDGKVKNGSWVFICQNDNCNAEKKITIKDVNDPDYDFDFHNPLHHPNAVKMEEGFREPTCDKSGIEKWYCADCYERNGATSGEYDVTSGTFDVVLEELSCEDYKINVKERIDETCFAAGQYEAFECEKCHKTYYYNHKNNNALVEYTDASAIVIPMRKHAYDVADSCAEGNPCTQPGCDYVKPALAHTVENVDAKDATCTAIGWDAYEYCTKCDYTTYNEIDMTEHNVVAGTPVAPTCTDPGYTYYACETCDTQDYIDFYTPATGHSYDEEPTTVVEATCTDDGEEIYNCLVCGEAGKKTVVIENKYNYVHKNAAGDVFTDTCVLGVSDYKCVQCNTTVEVTHGQIETTYDTDDCTKYIYKLDICVICEAHELSEVEKNEEHVYGDWEVVVDSTLTETGLKKKTCEYCAQYETAEIETKTGVQFDFAITNLVGETEADGYAGRIKLVIDLTASENITASNIALNIGFDNTIVNFVYGELKSADFTQDDLTFTAADIANNKGYVVVGAASKTGDVDLTNGEFAVLYFDINVEAIGETVSFNVNTATTDGSAASGVANVAGESIDAIYTEMPEVQTTRFGKLTAGDKVTLDDAAALLEMIMDEVEYCSEADLDKDGYILLSDYAIIRSLLIGNIESLG